MGEQELIDALDDCIEEVVCKRQSIDDCVKKYAGLEEELRPLLETAIRIKRLCDAIGREGRSNSKR